MVKIKFGTDGWRAVMGTEYTQPNVERLAQAFALYLHEAFRPESNIKKPRVALGYDFRDHSEDFALDFTKVLLANGIHVRLSDRAVPTPAVSRAVIENKFTAGIAITASHNPGNYNGVKIKDADGSSADTTITHRVESLIDQAPVKKLETLDPAGIRQDFLTPYLKALTAYTQFDLFNKKAFKILVDSMHGVGGTLIESILKGTQLHVTTIRGQRDITFGGTSPEPIGKYMPETLSRMKGSEYDIGLVTDGDADRIGAVRPGGEFVSPGTLLSLIMLHLCEDMGKIGSVVTTVSNTSLIYRVAKHLGLKIHETPVGFKYIVEIMRRENVLIAGEESGGLAFQNYMLERDGILSALLLIQMMEYRQKSFGDILKSVEDQFGKFHYVRKDTDYPEPKKEKLIAHLKEIKPGEVSGIEVLGKRTDDGVKFKFKNDAWLLFRLSGTEPLLRIYAESTSLKDAQSLVGWGESVAQSIR